MTTAHETTHYTTCPLDCPDLCSLEVATEEGRVTRIGATSRNPLTNGYLCSKVRGYAKHVYHDTRLHHPMVREGAKGEGRFRRASWDEALDLVARRLVEARDTHGGDSILPLSYGGSNGLMTDSSTDHLLFARLGACQLLRTVCAVPTGMAARGIYGGMRGVSYPDYAHSKLIVVWGANPHATGIHFVEHVKRAQEAGAKLIVVDPRRIPLARTADLHLPVRPGTDLPVALAVLRRLFREGGADEAFLAQHATGVDALRERAEPWTIERASQEAGLAADDLALFARLFAETSPAVVRCGWGLERNRNGGSAAAAVMSLAAVGGKFGVRGGGFTMSTSGAWALRSPVAADGWGRQVNMSRVGRELCERHDPPVQVLFVYNNNPLATLPNQELVRRGLEREDLFTVVSEQVMTDTARYADVLLPATTFLEHVELRKGYGAPLLSLGKPVIDPVGEARPNYEVFAELARRAGVWRDGDPETPEELCAAALAGEAETRATLDRDGFAAADPLCPVQFVDVFPGTPDGKVHLVPPDLDEGAPLGLYGYQEDPATAAYPLALVSPALARLVTSSLGELHTDEVPLDLHPDDAAARGIEDGAPIRVWNDLGEVLTSARVTEEVRPGTCCLPKGLWSHNTANGRTANALSPDTLGDMGGNACYNDARVQVERLSG
ncbi:MAG: molybdopterin-dependent oxidoreductase [Planctomycetota bacterium]